MRVSLEKGCELLRAWRSTGQLLSVTLSGGRSSISFLDLSGKVENVMFSEFIISSKDREVARISLSARFEMSEAEDSLRLLYPEGESVVIVKTLAVP